MESAEQAYLFRHALMRDAAYQLQLPTERSAVHLLALRLIPEVVHNADTRFPADMARHAQRALEAALPPAVAQWVHEQEVRYLKAWGMQCRANFDHDQARHAFSRLSSLSDLDATTRAEAIRDTGVPAWFAGRNEEATRLFREARDQARQAGATSVEAFSLANLATVLANTGALSEAVEAGNTAVKLARTTKDLLPKLAALNNLGSAHWALGDLDKAHSCFRKANRLARMHRDRKRVASTWMNLGLVCQNMGQQAAAEAHYLNALEQLEDIDLPQRIDTLGNLATLYMETQRPQRSLETFERCMQLSEQAGDLNAKGVFGGNFANLLRDTGKLDEALHMGGKAVRWARESGMLRSVGFNLCGLGHTKYLKGQLRAAESDLVLGIELCEQVAAYRGAAAALAVLSTIYLDIGKLELSASTLDRSARLAGLVQDPGFEVQILSVLCRRQVLLGLASFRETVFRISALQAHEQTKLSWSQALDVVAARVTVAFVDPECEFCKDLDTLVGRGAATAPMDPLVVDNRKRELARRLWAALKVEPSAPPVFRGHLLEELTVEARSTLYQGIVSGASATEEIAQLAPDVHAALRTAHADSRVLASSRAADT